MSAASDLSRTPQPDWDYCGVKLTISNIIIPDERLVPSPSVIDGMDSETELDVRFVGGECIQDAGILLKLPQVAMATAQILYQRFFCIKSFVRHFYELVICYLKALNQQSNSDLVQTAWNFVNDSLRTDIFVRYLPEAISCACIYLASCKLNIPLPRHPAWWEMFSVDDDSIHEISFTIMRLYVRPVPDTTILEADLARLRKVQTDAREQELEQRRRIQSQSNQASLPGSDASQTDTNGSHSLAEKTGADVTVPNRTITARSILASAIASAKAVAASVKAGGKNDDLGPSRLSPQSTVYSEQPTRPKLSDISDGANRPRREAGSPVELKPPSTESTKPAAYANPSQGAVHKHRKRHSRRRSPSSSSSSDDAANHRINGTTSDSLDSRSNNYRSKNDVRSKRYKDSGSGSSSSSPPKKRRYDVDCKRRHRRHSASPSPSNSSASSNSSNGTHRRSRNPANYSKKYRNASPVLDDVRVKYSKNVKNGGERSRQRSRSRHRNDSGYHDRHGVAYNKVRRR